MGLCGPHQGQDEARASARQWHPSSVLDGMNKEGGSGKDPLGGEGVAGGDELSPRTKPQASVFISQPLLPLGQTPHPPCLWENQPYLGLMGPLLAVRKLQCWRRGVGVVVLPRCV